MVPILFLHLIEVTVDFGEFLTMRSFTYRLLVLLTFLILALQALVLYGYREEVKIIEFRKKSTKVTFGIIGFV